MSFRNPDHYKRYEDVYIQPVKQPESRLANNTYQNRESYTFILKRNTPISIGIMHNTNEF